MIQYYSVKINVPQVSLVRESTTVETISKQLEYITKGYIATQSKFKMALFFSSF